METRKLPRFPVQCPITFSGDHIAGEGTVMNLSKNGWKVVSNQGVPDGACLAVRMSLPVASYPIMTRYYSPLEVYLAVVRWSTGREFGLELITMDAGEWKRIRAFVKTLEPSRVTSEIT